MIDKVAVTVEEIDRVYQKLKYDAEASGYFLNPDVEFTKELIKGLLTNERRYGYQSCPCRLASGNKADDLDIICPCDYRDPDLADYGACYCSLYLSRAAIHGEISTGPIPERRPPPDIRRKITAKTVPGNVSSLPLPVWRCTVCGYLCAREEPPEVCPICKAKKERFERFI